LQNHTTCNFLPWSATVRLANDKSPGQSGLSQTSVEAPVENERDQHEGQDDSRIEHGVRVQVGVDGAETEEEAVAGSAPAQVVGQVHHKTKKPRAKHG